MISEEDRQAAEALEIRAGKRRGGNKKSLLYGCVALVWKLKFCLLSLMFLPKQVGKLTLAAPFPIPQALGPVMSMVPLFLSTQYFVTFWDSALCPGLTEN